jgi:arginyl-tRNA synthetase
MSVSEQTRAVIREALSSLASGGVLGDDGASAVERSTWTVEKPARPEHGDLATNAALALAKLAKRPPRPIAEALARALDGGPLVASAEVAGPGFVNLRLRPAAFQAQVDQVLRAGKGYGRAPAGTGERIHLEFVSANPTGPVTVASGRNAILGDALARLLEAAGHHVTREYYVNDRGNQVRTFAESVRAAATGTAPPEDGYRGAYVAELATWLGKVEPDLLAKGDPVTLGRSAVAWMLRGIPGSRTLPGIRPSLADLGVHFDVWFSEESLYTWGAVGAVMQRLEAGGHLLRKDGALFFKAPEGAVEDKDRVVQKSDGSWAYFASDIAYFSDKIGRGYDRLINVLGADHHGYVARIRNALTALGLDEERFEALLYQLVFITKGGQVVKMGKRAGNIVTVDEVMDEIDDEAGRKGAGADALRFFFLSRSASSNVEFDIDLAKKKSLDNPVFYVQYGHARLCSILRNGAEIGLTPGRDFSLLTVPEELAIAQKLGELPAVVSEAARLREPHRIVFYVQDLARDFQSYYTRFGDSDPILPPKSTRSAPGWQATWDVERTRARLAWVDAVRVTYAAALALVGVSAPDRMERPREEPEQEEAAADARSA